MASLRCPIKSYLLLTKPGIVAGTILTMIGGFCLASRGQIDFSLLQEMTLGLSFVIAASCVFNNCIDQEQDAARERTKNRPLPRKEMSRKNALIYGSVLGLAGVVLLASFSSLFIVGLCLGGFFIYVVIYSLCAFRSVLVNVVGSISGGIPPVVGYMAVRQQVDLGACLLFLILFFWQIPHFLAIRFHRQATVGVLCSRKEKKTMVVFITLFLIAASLPSYFGYTGVAYLAGVATLGAAWLVLCARESLANVWARTMVHFSLVTIATLFLMIIAERL